MAHFSARRVVVSLGPSRRTIAWLVVLLATAALLGQPGAAAVVHDFDGAGDLDSQGGDLDGEASTLEGETSVLDGVAGGLDAEANVPGGETGTLGGEVASAATTAGVDSGLDTAGAPGADSGDRDDHRFDLPAEPSLPPAILVFASRRGAETDLRDDDPPALDNEARATIFEAVTESPGSSMSQVAERAGIPLSTVRYHSRILSTEDVIDEAKIRGKRRLYPATMAPGQQELAAALADDATAGLLAAAFRLEPATVSELADELDLAVSTVSYHLARLEEADLLERERDGDATVTRLVGVARAEFGADGTTIEAGPALD